MRRYATKAPSGLTLSADGLYVASAGTDGSVTVRAVSGAMLCCAMLCCAVLCDAMRCQVRAVSGAMSESRKLHSSAAGGASGVALLPPTGVTAASEPTTVLSVGSDGVLAASLVAPQYTRHRRRRRSLPRAAHPPLPPPERRPRRPRSPLHLFGRRSATHQRVRAAPPPRPPPRPATAPAQHPIPRPGPLAARNAATPQRRNAAIPQSRNHAIPRCRYRFSSAALPLTLPDARPLPEATP